MKLSWYLPQTLLSDWSHIKKALVVLFLGVWKIVDQPWYDQNIFDEQCIEEDIHEKKKIHTTHKHLPKTTISLKELYPDLQSLADHTTVVDPVEWSCAHWFDFNRQYASIIRGCIMRYHNDTLRNSLVALFDKYHILDQCWSSQLPHDRYGVITVSASLIDLYDQHKNHLLGIKPSSKKQLINKAPLWFPQSLFIERLIDVYQDSLIHLALRNDLDLVHNRKEYNKYKDRDYTFESSPGMTTKHGKLYVSYDIVSEYLISSWCKIRSTLKWYEEDGSSMGFLRTWTEITARAYESIQRLVTLFKSEYPTTPLIVNGMREFGHSLTEDRLVSFKEDKFGKPVRLLTNSQYNKSHEMGECVDFALLGESGVVLVQWLTAHTIWHPKNTPLKEKKKYRFRTPWYSFDYIIHWSWVINNHVHVYL